MKINFIIAHYPAPIGGLRVVYEYANELARRGHEIAIYHSMHIRQDPPPPSVYGRVRRLAGDIRRRANPNTAWFALDEGVRLHYVPEPLERFVAPADVVFATAWQTADYVVDYAADKGRKFYLVQDFGDYFGPLARLEATWKMPFRKVAVSRWLYDMVAEVAGPGDLEHIPNGIGHDRFYVAAGVERRAKHVAFVHSPAPYKAPEDAIRAIELCRAAHSDLEVTVFGRQPRPADLPAWFAYRQNVPDTELAALYTSAAIFLCSSLAEGFALPPAEAMACGCAVVSTDCGGIRDYARDGENALLSPPRDAAALAANLGRLLSDEALTRKFAAAGRALIETFTWPASTDRLERFLGVAAKARNDALAS